MANIIPYAERLRLGADDVVLMASPMAHQTGFMYGLMMPIMLRASAVLQDIWEPKQGDRADPRRRRQLHDGLDAVPDRPGQDRAAKPARRCPRCAPSCAPARRFPAPLVEQARKVLGTKIVSAWGMTENGAVTLIQLDDDDERAFTTDGCPLPGVEVKVVDADGQALPRRRGGQAAACARAPTSAATCTARS